jgi:hypothetical protein
VAIPLLVTGACKNDPSLCLGQPPIPVANADPPYFYFAINDLPGNLLPSKGNLGPNLGTWTAFGADGDVLGATPTTSGILPAGAYSIGLAPSAGPLGAPTCTLITPSDPTQTPFYSCSSPWKYALCASLPTNGNGQSPRPAVATYYAVATSGETWLSAPYRPFLQFDGTPAFVCPSGM